MEGILQGLKPLDLAATTKAKAEALAYLEAKATDLEAKATETDAIGACDGGRCDVGSGVAD
jgi:hypothetical protein